MRNISFSNLRTPALALLLTALVTGIASAVAGHQVPLKGSAAGTVVYLEPTPEGLHFTIAASGHATQLGHFDRLEQLYFNTTTHAISGTVTFLAANQDSLTVSISGAFNPPTALGTYTIISGSGRFLGATGSADFVAVSTDGEHMSVDFDGTISTVGG